MSYTSNDTIPKTFRDKEIYSKLKKKKHEQNSGQIILPHDYGRTSPTHAINSAERTNLDKLGSVVEQPLGMH